MEDEIDELNKSMSAAKISKRETKRKK